MDQDEPVNRRMRALPGMIAAPSIRRPQCSIATQSSLTGTSTDACAPAMELLRLDDLEEAFHGKALLRDVAAGRSWSRSTRQTSIG
jgi:hypothetical protein